MTINKERTMGLIPNKLARLRSIAHLATTVAHRWCATPPFEHIAEHKRQTLPF